MSTSIEDIVREIVKDELRKVIPARAPQTRVDALNRIYSVREAAELLGVSHSYVYDRIRAGELAVVELGNGEAGGKQRIAATELQRFIESRTYPR